MFSLKRLKNAIKGEQRCPDCGKVGLHPPHEKMNSDLRLQDEFWGRKVDTGHYGYTCKFCGSIFTYYFSSEFFELARVNGETSAIHEYREFMKDKNYFSNYLPKKTSQAPLSVPASDSASKGFIKCSHCGFSMKAVSGTVVTMICRKCRRETSGPVP